jgi:hypothetical protein
MQTQIHSLRYYAPVKDAHFAFAKHARLLMPLNENGQSGGSYYPAYNAVTETIHHRISVNAIIPR